VIAAAGIDTWSPAWYCEDGGPAHRWARAFAVQRVSRGFVAPGDFAGHRVGWYPEQRLLYAEGHPAEDELCPPGELPAALDRVVAAMADHGLQVPTGEHASWTLDLGDVTDRYPHGAFWRGAGFAGVRRLDATVDMRFVTAGEGLAVLAGVLGLGVLSPGLGAVGQWGHAGRLETVYYKGRGGRKTLGRWYDKGVELGELGPGLRLRIEDQRRWDVGGRRSVAELTPEYVRAMFQRRFMPLWRASSDVGGVTVGSPLVLAGKLIELVDAEKLKSREAERLAGFLLLDAVGGDETLSRTSRWRRRRECLEHGLVPDGGVLEEVEIDLHDVLEQALETDRWGGQG
jgi:hypothetical protein